MNTAWANRRKLLVDPCFSRACSCLLWQHGPTDKGEASIIRVTFGSLSDGLGVRCQKVAKSWVGGSQARERGADCNLDDALRARRGRISELCARWTRARRPQIRAQSAVDGRSDDGFAAAGLQEGP
jgi:hypothetical protein